MGTDRLNGITERCEIIQGHALEVLRGMPEKSVQCCITSPPYWGLRQYDAEPVVWGAAEGCVHEWGEEVPGDPRGGSGPAAKEFYADGGKSTYARQVGRGFWCQRCGAWRGQLGLEPTIDLFIGHLVEIFREVKRVLRDDGTAWVNMGDAYANGKPKAGYSDTGSDLGWSNEQSRLAPGMKAKDLIGQPWRLAFALQADGWWLRSDIIWSKPAPMPESVTDRPTRAHEYVFLLTKSGRYYYDAEAVRGNGVSGPSDTRKMIESLPRIAGKHKTLDDPLSKASAATNIGQKRAVGAPGTRNMRTVWTIGPEPMRYSHFAAYPRALVRPCLRAGTSEKGCCPDCGAPWERVVEKTGGSIGMGDWVDKTKRLEQGMVGQRSAAKSATTDGTYKVRFLGWRPTCECYVFQGADFSDLPVVPCVVLDPFAGTGTTLVVAKEEGRSGFGIELSEEYAAYARARIRAVKPGQYVAQPVTSEPLPLLETAE